MDAPVIIVGAGPVGLSAACALARHGVATVVLDAREGPGTQSRALGVLPRSMEILRGWGVLDAFLAAGTLRETFPVWVVGEETPRVSLDLAELKDVCAVPGLLLLPQHQTEALLARHLASSGLGELLWGHRVEDVEPDVGGVTIRVHREGRGDTLMRADWLIGCDGSRSTVRSRLGLRMGGRTFSTRFLVADVRLAEDRDLPWPRVAPSRFGLVAGIRAGPLWRVIATVQDTPSLREHVAALFGTDRFEPVWVSIFRVHCRTCASFRAGRVLLAGDAAHLDSPAGGQGMNAGIQDAHNLAWKLARALAGADAEALAQSYDTERRGAIRRFTHRYTSALTRLVLLPPPLRVIAIRLAQRVLRRVGPRRLWLTRAAMLDVCYRSPLVSGSGPLLGARAPDGALYRSDDSAVLLHDLASRDALLLLFGIAPVDVRSALTDVPGVAVHEITTRREHQDALVDPGGRLTRALRAEHGTAILVRPDGHVGWRQRNPTWESLQRGVRRALGQAGA